MGITEQRPDILQEIYGVQAQSLKEAAALLLEGRLPPGWNWVPCSKQAVVACFTEGSQVYFKQFLPRNCFEGIKALLRGSRCQRARRQSELLLAKGFLSAETLCWGRGRHYEFMMTAGIPGIGLETYLIEHGDLPPSKEAIRRKRQVLAEVGAIIGRLHKKGIVHGDLRPNNVLIEETKDGRRYFFIDNEGNRQWGKIPLRQVRRNLVHISLISPKLVSRTDYLRFFEAYEKEYPRFSGPGRKEFLDSVFVENRRKLARYASRRH